MLMRLIAYLRGMTGRRRSNAEADDELQFHIEQETAANIARGMTPAEARRVALRDLGGLTQATEAVRDVRITWLDAVWRDMRYAVRTLRRTPAFTISALATLALVIGANSAVFSLADVILLRPLPYPQPERLAYVSWQTPNGFSTAVNGLAWEAIRDKITAIDVTMATSGRDRINFNTDDTAAFVVQARVGTGYFRVLGMPPFLGREFTPDEDRPDGPLVVVISHSFWERVFQSDPFAVGRTLFLRGDAYQIVGVAPPEFAPAGPLADVFTPVRPARTGEGGGTNYRVIARLVDGRDWPEAEVELANASQGLIPPGRQSPDATRRLAARPLHTALTTDAREPVQILMSAGLMVLLIACVNIAALMLARGTSRKQELVTRLALGSSRSAIVRQLVVESLILGIVGGALGVLVAHVCLATLQAIGDSTFGAWSSATIDARAIAVTGAVSVLAALLFGLLPALSSSHVDVSAAVTESGSRSIAGGARHLGRRVLIVAEVALSVVLLVVTGLFVRTLVNLDNLDPGFDARNVSVTSVSLQDARYSSAAAINQLFDTSLTELVATPGVESAAISLGIPYNRLLNYTFHFADRPDNGNVSAASFMYTTPTFFDTLRIPVRAGRTFTSADRAGQQPVVVVNDAFVRFLAEGESPINRYLLIDDVEWQIVGIVGDVQVRNSGLAYEGMLRGPLETQPVVFLPAAQITDSFAQLVHQWFMPHWTVRTSGQVNVELALRRAINNANALLPVSPVTRLEETQASATAFHRLLLTLIGAFAVAALLLAVIGIYGLIAQTVAERTREIGIRLALGATIARSIRTVTVSGLAITATGVIIGLVLAWTATQLVASFLWGVSHHDPATFTAIAGVLLVVAAVASVLPALRIVRIDPARILRE